jgi:hypothetical protein
MSAFKRDKTCICRIGERRPQGGANVVVFDRRAGRANVVSGQH